MRPPQSSHHPPPPCQNRTSPHHYPTKKKKVIGNRQSVVIRPVWERLERLGSGPGRRRRWLVLGQHVHLLLRQVMQQEHVPAHVVPEGELFLTEEAPGLALMLLKVVPEVAPVGVAGSTDRADERSV